MFCKKVVLKNFAKLTGKCFCYSLFFSNAASLRHATLSKRRLWHRCFPVNFAKFLRTPFFIEHIRELLLYISMVPLTRKENSKHFILVCSFSTAKLLFRRNNRICREDLVSKVSSVASHQTK